MPHASRLPAVLTSAAFVLFVAIGGVWAVTASASPQPKITYCHRTASTTNPYVAHTTDANSIISHGHGDHTGPIFPATGPDGKWGDVIPPFDYNGGHFAGLNWTAAGQALVNSGCDSPESSSSSSSWSTSDSSSSSTSDSTSDSTSSSTSDSTSESTSDSTSDSTSSSNNTDSSTSDSTSSSDSTTTTTLVAVPPSSNNQSPNTPTLTEHPATTLARTGRHDVLYAALGMVLLAVGGLLLFAERRRQAADR